MKTSEKESLKEFCIQEFNELENDFFDTGIYDTSKAKQITELYNFILNNIN